MNIRPTPAFEWVLTTSRGDDFYLTEGQHEQYKANQDGGKLFFDDFELNPAFVVSGFKRPAQEILLKYPCKKCKAAGFGYTDNWTDPVICPDCGGTGIAKK